MQLRSTIVIAGALLAILAPTAGAAVAPDPIGDGSGTALKASKTHDYAGLVKRAVPAATGPITENSNGAGLPQKRPVAASSRKAGLVKRTAAKPSKKTAKAAKIVKKPATHVVVSPMIVVPGGPLVSNGSSDALTDCTTYMVNCTNEQFCNIWGFSCALVGSDVQANDEAPASTPNGSAQSTPPAESTPPADSNPPAQSNPPAPSNGSTQIPASN